MSHSIAGRFPASREGDRRVGLFIDFDALRDSDPVSRGGEGRPAPSDPAELARRLREFAEEHGRLLVAAAYGDWTEAAAEARGFLRQHIEPRMAAGTAPGEETSELVLSLDVVEALHSGPRLDTIVVVTDDRPYEELYQRVRRADRAFVLVAAEGAPARDAAPVGNGRVVALADVLAGATAHAPGVVPVDFSAFDWAPFLRLVDDLERNMPFVGFGWLLKKKLNAENSGCTTLADRQELMDRAVDDGLLTLYKVDNIEQGADPVTACRLNREHPTVRSLVAVPEAG